MATPGVGWGLEEGAQHSECTSPKLTEETSMFKHFSTSVGSRLCSRIFHLKKTL